MMTNFEQRYQNTTYSHSHQRCSKDDESNQRSTKDCKEIKIFWKNVVDPTRELLPNPMSSFLSNSSNSAADNFLLESLMDRLQVRNPVNNPLVTQSVEDYLYGDFKHEEDAREIIPYEVGREELIREEKKLEKEIINIIVNGKGDSLMPNSGEAVTVLGHNICVGCEEDDEGDCMVWEWHGHITAYTDQYGYSLEHIYGCYFQRWTPKPLGEEKKAEEKRNQGLKDLIEDNKDSNAARILHRNVNARSPRLRV